MQTSPYRSQSIRSATRAVLLPLLFAASVAGAGCGAQRSSTACHDSGAPTGTTGSGGSASPETGGQPGTGGSATGGSTGSGGATGTGGGSGGAGATGGGSGGTVGTGGVTGAGGVASAGGSIGSGGASGSGGSGSGGAGELSPNPAERPERAAREGARERAVVSSRDFRRRRPPTAPSTKIGRSANVARRRQGLPRRRQRARLHRVFFGGDTFNSTDVATQQAISEAGNYAVTVALGGLERRADPDRRGRPTASSWRSPCTTTAGQCATYSFVVNVRANEGQPTENVSVRISWVGPLLLRDRRSMAPEVSAVGYALAGKSRQAGHGLRRE